MIGLLPFGLALVVTSLVTPHVRDLATKIGAVAHPGGRHVHRKPVPRLGGLGVFLGFWMGVVGFGLALPGKMPLEMAGVFMGTLVLLLLGIYDDMGDAPVRVKLPIQVIAAHMTYFFGLRFQLFASLAAALGLEPTPGVVEAADYFLTIAWIVGITNAMNFMDGLDGLATSLAFVAAAALLLLTELMDLWIFGLVLLALVGALAAFFRYNGFPASIFLGDTGATFLGFSLASLCVMVCHGSHTSLGVRMIPLFVLAVPISDTVYAVIRRCLAGVNVFASDRGHLHHRLLDMGYSAPEAVRVLVLASLVMTFAAMFLLKASDALTLLLAALGAAASAAVAFRLRLFDRKVIEAGKSP